MNYVSLMTGQRDSLCLIEIQLSLLERRIFNYEIPQATPFYGMMASWRGNAFNFTDHVWGESTFHIYSPHKGQVMWSF